MSQQRLTKLQEKTQQRIAPRKTRPASAQSFHGGLHPILQLQQTLGNRRVAQLMQAKQLTPEGKMMGLQRKLTVGAADDPYEQEADRVAHQVINTSDAVATNSMQRAGSPEEDKDQMLQTKSLAASITPFMQRQTVHTEASEDQEQPVQAKFSTETSKAPLQRQPETEEEETEPIQAKSAGAMSDSFEAGADVETQVSQSKGRGSPLPDPVRTYMEPRFGVDFSQVRIHTGSDALQMNQAVGAQAFTHGSDIYFGAGHSPTNLELTAHELTHVVQQTGGAALTQDTSSVQRQQQDAVSAPDAVSKVPVSLCHDSAVLHLQRSPGNRFVQRLLAREMAAGERTGEAPVEGVPVQEVGEAAAPDLSQVNENGEIDGAITSNVYPHVFVNGGKTGSAMVHWVGGTGGMGNQPVGSIDLIAPVYENRNPTGSDPQGNAWIRPGTGTARVTRSFTGAPAGPNGPTAYLTTRGSIRADVHERLHIASSRTHHNTDINPLERRVARHRGRSAGLSAGATGAEAQTALQTFVDWNTAVTNFANADTTDNTPGGTVDANDLASGTYLSDFGPRVVRGVNYAHYYDTPPGP